MNTGGTLCRNDLKCEYITEHIGGSEGGKSPYGGVGLYDGSGPRNENKPSGGEGART